MHKLKLGEDPRFIFVEDVLKSITSTNQLLFVLTFFLLPKFILERTLFRNARKGLDDLATIIFTSGSTGEPKGVQLSEGNILSNIQSIEMILQTSKKDTILGVLPFFHSFGFTTSLWLPLLAGFKAVYHMNPLDTKIIGEISRKNKITL